MANRHQRRKRAALKEAAKQEAIALAEKARLRAKIVRANKSAPIDSVTLRADSAMRSRSGSFLARSHLSYRIEARATGHGQPVKDKPISRVFRDPDNVGWDIDGKAILEASQEALQAKLERVKRK